MVADTPKGAQTLMSAVSHHDCTGHRQSVNDAMLDVEDDKLLRLGGSSTLVNVEVVKD